MMHKSHKTSVKYIRGNAYDENDANFYTDITLSIKFHVKVYCAGDLMIIAGKRQGAGSGI